MHGDKVSVIIPTYNRLDKLKRLLGSVMSNKMDDMQLEVIVVDDAGPSDVSAALTKEYPNVKVIRHKKERYLAASRNTGIKAATGNYIFCVDDDNVLDKNCIINLVHAFRMSKSIGMAVPYMLYLSKPDTIWSAGTRISKRLLSPSCNANEKYRIKPSFIHVILHQTPSCSRERL